MNGHQQAYGKDAKKMSAHKTILILQVDLGPTEQHRHLMQYVVNNDEWNSRRRKRAPRIIVIVMVQEQINTKNVEMNINTCR